MVVKKDFLLRRANIAKRGGWGTETCFNTCVPQLKIETNQVFQCKIDQILSHENNLGKTVVLTLKNFQQVKNNISGIFVLHLS